MSSVGNLSGSLMLVVQVRAAITTEDGQTRVCHVDAAPRQLGLLKLPASAVSGPNRCQWAGFPGDWKIIFDEASPIEKCNVCG